MRKNILFGILLVAVIFFSLALFVFSQNLDPNILKNNSKESEKSSQETPSNNILGKLSNKIVLETSIPKMPEKILIYKTISHRHTRQEIISLAKKFNMNTTGQIKEVAEGSSIASGDGIYAIMKNSGSIEYTNSNRADTVNPLDAPEKIPSDQDAEKIATKFLKDRNLLPDGAEYIGTEHNKIYRLGENGNDIVVYDAVEVWYGRMLNDLKVSGTQISIVIGGGGDIIDYYSNWRDYEPYKELPIKSPEKAFSELKNRGVSVGMNNPDKVSIDDVYLAYHTKPGAENEEYLEPIWMFKGNMIVDGKAGDSVEAYIPALTDDAVKSLTS